jgi:hypothetical protein
MHWVRLRVFFIFRHFASALESGEERFAGRLAFVPRTPCEAVRTDEGVGLCAGLEEPGDTIAAGAGATTFQV